MNRTVRMAGLVSTALVVLGTAGAANASPSPTPWWQAPPTITFKTLADARPGTTAATATCTLTVDSPHYSKNAGSVIGKARVKCSSTTTIYVKGDLGSVSGGKCSPNTVAYGPPVPRWSGTSARQTIKTGATATFYLPPDDYPTKFTTNASWYDSAAAYNSAKVKQGSASNARYTGPACP